MTVLFLGDSITEGCFELFDNHVGGFDTVKDIPSAYPTLLAQRIGEKYSDISFINAGVAGNSSADCVKRLETDVLAARPDIVCVCLGLNDVCRRNPQEYIGNLEKIFTGLLSIGSRVIFMTPNMLNKYVHPFNLPLLNETANDCAECQNNGTMDRLMERAKQCAKQYGVSVCDVYSEWKRMERYGIDTTSLLCNHINHPIRQMHLLFADCLQPYIEAEIDQMKLT